VVAGGDLEALSAGASGFVLKDDPPEQLILTGLSNAEIGAQLYISDTTVKTHVTHILQKLNLRDRVQAVVMAYQTGLYEGQ
jgi:DNA-binding NarL/FixJ family response regulator